MISLSMTLEQINDELRRRRLKLLNKAGDPAKGEDQIVGIAEIWDRASKFHTSVVYQVRRPDGSEYEHLVHYNANSMGSEGIAVVAKINDRFAVVYQYRVARGCWTYEIARGFESKATRESASPEFAVACLRRELGDTLMDAATVSGSEFLGDAPDNTGVSAMATKFWLVELRIPENIVAENVNRSVNGIKLLLWPESRIERERGRKLRDLHSMTALTLLEFSAQSA
jgi:hypothetical protein